MGHQGWKNDANETAWKREPFSEPICLYNDDDRDYGRDDYDSDHDLDEDVPRYNVSDLYLTYLDSDEWQPTGHDGGYYHFWNCLTCNETFRITDK
jgi:hypothetical protein